MTNELSNLDIDALKLICRDISAQKLKGYIFADDIEAIEEVDFDKKNATRKRMSIIFISTQAVKIGFKCYFSKADAEEMAGKALGQPVSELSQHSVDDFVKEFCNLVAGGLKRGIEVADLRSLISLPLLTRSEDSELFQFRKSSEGSKIYVFKDTWGLKYKDHVIGCEVSFEVYDKETIQRLIITAFSADDEDDEDGDIDFL